MVTLKIGYFHSPESLSLHLKNQQTLFLGLFITKTKVKFQFFNSNRGLTALEKSFIQRLYTLDIFIVQKDFLFILNISKHYFQVYLEQKETKFKFKFFNLNHGLTPLVKSLIMVSLETGHFHSPDRLSFHLTHQQILFLGLFRTKTNKVQFSIFQLKPWVNPFGKITNMATLQVGHFHSTENLSFHLKHQHVMVHSQEGTFVR